MDLRNPNTASYQILHRSIPKQNFSITLSLLCHQPVTEELPLLRIHTDDITVITVLLGRNYIQYSYFDSRMEFDFDYSLSAPTTLTFIQKGETVIFYANCTWRGAELLQRVPMWPLPSVVEDDVSIQMRGHDHLLHVNPISRGERGGTGINSNMNQE